MQDANQHPPMGAPAPAGPAPSGGAAGGGGAQGGQAGAQNLQVDIPDAVKAGVYSNAVSLTVDAQQVVADFGYLLPNTPKPTIQVVSRVNMNLKTAKSFLKVMEGAIADFEKKQAEQAAKAAAPQPGAHTAPAAPMHSAPAPLPGAPVAPAAPMHPAPTPGAPSGHPPAGPAMPPPPAPLPTNA